MIQYKNYIAAVRVIYIDHEPLDNLVMLVSINKTHEHAYLK